MKSAVDFVREHARSHEVLVLAATIEAADDLVRRACDTALTGVHRFTPYRLAWVIAEPSLAGSSLTPVRGLGSLALAASVVHEVRAAGRLNYFAPIADTPGFPRALMRTIRELRLQGIGREGAGRAGQAGPDLAALLGEYERQLEKRSLADEADVYAAAIARVRSGGHALTGIPLVLLEFESATQLECDFLDALREQSRAVFYHEPEPAAATALGSLQRHLFGTEEVPPHDADDSFTIFSASTEALECVEIARRIRRAAGEGRRFDQTAIFLREPSTYQPLMEEALRRAGIPAWFARGAARPHASGRAFLILLACAQEDLSAARFAEYLSLDVAPRKLAVSRCERVLADLEVSAGRERWVRRIGAAIERYGDDPKFERLLEAAHQLREFALPLIDALADLPRSASWGEWFAALGNLAEMALEEPDPVLDLLDELAPMADSGPAGLESVRLLLGDRLRSLDPEPPASRYGRVFVAPIENAPGMHFETVFVPGLCEGIFPKPVLEDPLLIDANKKLISADLATTGEDRERKLFERAAKAAAGALVISYPRLDVLAGRERVPSLYVFEASRAAQGSARDLRRLHEEARAGAETQLAWPAPASPGAALDDIEYDLALLKEVFSTKEDGGAAYLDTVSRTLLDVLRIRGRRWRKKWRSADGMVDADMGTIKLLEQHLPSVRPHSPTSLQRYAACPYRFLLASIVGLRPLDRRQTYRRMEPAARGELFHRVVATALGKLSAADALPFRGEDLGKVYELLDRTLDGLTAEMEEEQAPESARLWKVDIEELRADLRGWAEQKAWDDAEWVPQAWEREFGKDEPVVVLDGLQLKGAIDLVERHASGALRIVDFKTGRVPEQIPVATGGGQVLQPALYALAAEKITGAPVAAGRLHYATLRGNYQAIEIRNDERTHTGVRGLVHAIEEGIRSGFLPPAPVEDACKHCDYQPVCGPYEEERVRIKDQTDLKALADVRRCP